MELISDKYKQLNQRLHQVNKKYGPGRADLWEDIALELVSDNDAQSFLDYGCGKGNLVKSLQNKLDISVQGYDPCVEEFKELPIESDIVMCVDVLEHVEEENIHQVLEHIKQLTNKVAFFHIILIPSDKKLPDGRNAHILLKSSDWWKEILTAYFPRGHVTDSTKKYIQYLWKAQG